MSKHTPGPWELATSCSWRRFVGPDGSTVCEPITQHSDGHPDLYFRNGGANGPDALLIAATPEMYELLKELAADQNRCGPKSPFWRRMTRVRALLEELDNAG